VPVSASPTFRLTLHRTYYNQGFFNVPVDYDKFVRAEEGLVTLLLGEGEEQIEGHVDRRANQTGAARIMGRAALKRWFQANFTVGDRVNVIFKSPQVIQLVRS
jgi:hypothetical protein